MAARPVKWLTSASRDFGAITCTAPTQAASAPQAAGQIRPQSASAAATAAGSAPITAISDPSSESSPSATLPATASRGRTSIAASTARAIGRSKCEPSFGKVGGREVDGDPLGRQRQPHRGEGGAYAFLGFGDRLVGEAHEIEGRQAGGDGALHFDEARLDALERHGIGPRHHAIPVSFRQNMRRRRARLRAEGLPFG